MANCSLVSELDIAPEIAKRSDLVKSNQLDISNLIRSLYDLSTDQKVWISEFWRATFLRNLCEDFFDVVEFFFLKIAPLAWL